MYLNLLIKSKHSGLQVIDLDLALGQPSHDISLREILVLVHTGDGGIIVAIVVDSGAGFLDGGARTATL
jgi:hypothetical protein